MNVLIYFNLLFLIKANTINCDTLKQLHIIFRHGERSPTESYPNDPHKDYEWPGGLGHLTNRGKLQMYTVGLRLRELYDKFLPQGYWPDDVIINSSYAERCHMSAQLVTAGLFPPTGPQIWNEDLLWQPVPVHYAPRSQDNIIAMKQSCKSYDEAFKSVQKSPKVNDINKNNFLLYEFLSNKTGTKINNIGVIETLFNTLYIQKINNLTLPSWVNDTLMVKMEELAALNLALYSDSTFMKRMKGGVFLKKVIDDMKSSIENKKMPKVFLYSGHDLSLVNILRTLDAIKVLKPQFGAAIIFELHENLDDSSYSVNILYSENWKTENLKTLDLEYCHKCSLETFNQELVPVLPDDWDLECEKY